MKSSVARVGSNSLIESVTRFLYDEAALLDQNDIRAWHGLLHDDFTYEVPIPITRDDPSAGRHSVEGFLARETRESLGLWVERLSEKLIRSAFSENPPVRTKHLLTNIRLVEVTPSAIALRCYVLLTWSRLSEPPRFVPAERFDELVVDDISGEDQFRLRHRRVLLDSQTVYLNHLRVIF